MAKLFLLIGYVAIDAAAQDYYIAMPKMFTTNYAVNFPSCTWFSMTGHYLPKLRC